MVSVLLTTTFLSGEGNTASVQNEWGVSSHIFPITKEIVKTIDSAKDDKDAWEKLCGKKLLQGGLLRNKDAMNLAKVSPHFATLVAYICHAYPGFEGSDISKIIKNKLWGLGSDKKLFKMLMGTEIKATDVTRTTMDPDGTWHYKWSYGGIPKTVVNELAFYGKLPGINNTKYPVCKVTREDKLPKPMRDFKALVNCTKSEHDADTLLSEKVEKTPPPRPRYAPKTDHGYANNLRPSLKDLDDHRKNTRDEWNSGRNYAAEALNDLDTSFEHDEDLPQINSPKETPNTGKNTRESLLQASKDLSKNMKSMTNVLDKSQQEQFSHSSPQDDPVTLAEEALKKAEANYRAKQTLANRQAQTAAGVALAKAKHAARAEN